MTLGVVLTTDARGHSAYAELLAAPPPGVAYDARPLHWGHRLTSSAAADWLRWRRYAAARALCGDPLPFPAPDWGKPVHAANVLLRSPRPWVVDFEHPWAFTAFDGARLLARRGRLRAAIAEARLLLPWTEAAARALVALAPDAAPRVRVVRPAVRAREPARADAPSFLFVARLFERKGGPETLEAFARVRRAHPDATLTMVTDAPPGLAAAWAERGVRFLPPTQPRERLLDECFATASAYVMPTQFDTFGMVFLEAFAHALPVVTLEGFGTDEIVEDGVDGFVLPGYRERWFDADGLPRQGASTWEQLRLRRRQDERERVVRDLAARMAELAADPAKARRMGEAGRRKVAEGAFSPGARGDALLAAYREAFGEAAFSPKER